MITQDIVRGLFDYREDGVLIWKVALSWRVRMGDVAGSVSKKFGYTTVTFFGKHHFAHRIVWLWHHGYLPEHDIDHINRKRADNRIENLREVTRSCNLRNKGNSPSNTSGVKGVDFDKSRTKWRVQIKVNGRNIFIGRYNSFTEAACHRLAAEQFLDWDGCDSSSPAFQFVKKSIGKPLKEQKNERILR